MRTLLILGTLDPGEERVFGAMAAASKFELVTCSKVEAAIAWLEAHAPKIVLFKAEARGADRLCQKVRSQANLATVPLIGLVSDTSDAFVERWYALGADDIVFEKIGPGFVTRLKTLPDNLASPPRRGLAIVGEPQRLRCHVVGRVLTNAGYDVRAAHDSISLSYYIQQHAPRLVVASVDLGTPREHISRARQHGYSGPWIATARRRDFHRYAEALAGLERVSVVAATGAPEIILFAANELLRAEAPPARSEERHLYGTSVLFRAPGDEVDELGFSYNVSTRGMFVRTLAPIECDEVWVDLRPPRCRQRVRLEGRVAWRAPYVPTAAATGPPGFGIEFTRGLGSSLSVWTEHVQAFVASALAGAVRTSTLATTWQRDSRTSGEYMLLEVPSESRLAIATALGEGTSPPPPGDPSSEALPPLPQPKAFAVDSETEPTEPEPTRMPQSELDSTSPSSQESTVTPRVHGWPLVGWGAVGLTAGAIIGIAGFSLQQATFRPVTRNVASEPAQPVGPPEAAAHAMPSLAPSTPAASGVAEVARPAPDARALPWNQGHLLVRSSRAADVYSTGFKAGATNQTNTSKCGLRWVRLGNGTPPRWISPGRTVDVKCQELTTIEIEPGPSNPAGD